MNLVLVAALGREPPVSKAPGSGLLPKRPYPRIHGACFIGCAILGFQLLAAVLLAPAAAAPAGPPDLLKRGEVLFATGFEGTEALKDWQGSGSLVPAESGGQVVRLDNPAGRGASLSRSLPVERVRGCQITIRARVRAEKVSAKPNPWNGIKCMLPIDTPAGRLWPQAPIDTGTFDWREAAFSARVPQNATGLRIVLGLEEVTGTAWFDDVRISVRRGPVPVPAPRAGPLYRGHDLPRLRGTMISPNITPESLRVLGQEWNANVLRWQLIRTGAEARDASLGAYDRWLDDALQRLDTALPWCERYGLYVVVDLHSPPGGKLTSGGYAGSDSGLFADKAAQDHFIAVWQKIARRYREARAIWGYDLANEPVEGAAVEGLDDWQELAARAARAVRAIDPNRTLIIEPADWGSPGGLEHFAPLDVSNVVYSVHMYIPHGFTHQGVFSPSAPVRYPGVVEGRNWDKAALETALQPAVDFQNKYNVHIYIGEFSAIRWAPDGSAARYLSDVIDICENHGWDWTYHAFREWSGWSVEHGPVRDDARPASQPTDRQKLLCGWFAKNKKPAWTGQGDKQSQ